MTGGLFAVSFGWLPWKGGGGVGGGGMFVTEGEVTMLRSAC